MTNPIIQQLRSPSLNNVRQMVNMVKSARNPQAMLNQIMQSNPNYRQVTDLINQNGGDPKKAFYALAQQQGIDPNEILDMLR